MLRTFRFSALLAFPFSALLSFLALSIFISLPVSAQQTRVAFIDAEKILKRLPEAKDADARFEQLKSSWSREATEMQNEIDRKQAEFDRRKLIMTDPERNAADLELTNLKKKHTDFLQSKFGPEGELFQQQASLMKPAYDKLSTAIHECAADGNYDYVIDRSSKDIVLLYVNSKFDLTLPVARKLGIESEIISTPLVNNKQGQPTQPGKPGEPPNALGQNQAPGSQGGTTPGTIPGTTPGTQSTGIPNTNFPNPALGNGLTPNNGTNSQPPSPGYNSGGNNPGQQPPPPQTQPAPGH